LALLFGPLRDPDIDLFATGSGEKLAGAGWFPGGRIRETLQALPFRELLEGFFPCHQGKMRLFSLVT
jgi:hypothetical protein